MLISFSVENWMSFRDKVSFSMVASRERQHSERVPRIEKYKTRILPVAAIYGGNASGKTNLFNALYFVRRLVVEGTRPDSLIPINPFGLDFQAAEHPSRFAFELFIDECIYEFSFAVTRKAVIEEKLIKVASSGEEVLYNRKDGESHFSKELQQNQLLEFAFKGTRDNQLFLTNSVSQNVTDFRPIYDWFKYTLELVAPDSKFRPFEQFLDDEQPLSLTMNKMLRLLDTGIAHLDGEEIPFENVPLAEPLKTRLQEDVKEGMTRRFRRSGRPIIVTRKNGVLTAKKLVTYHLMSDGKEIKFEMEQESDGTLRVIDLLPAFLEISAANSKKVYVIDELDRSLHTLLTRRLLETYLGTCSVNSRAQLLFTTHDVLLMDQQLLRRDEMWVAERNSTGVSNILSFSEYKDVRYDKDIRKSYLQGRFGGIPRILLNSGALTNEKCGGGDDAA